MRILKIAAVTAVAMMSVPAVAFADDFEALCTAADKSEPTVKSCKCASDKLAGADRTAAIDAMKAVNTAMAAGKAEEAAAATQKHGKGLEIMMTAQATCM
ncbi:hypothetical protein ABMY26_10490 [Azospirillum sp. HJ39]|uniref:hypothetical protein n=1 Tax=Azospirillum sp. HJ39 TaxID=3159496 RepID=UPI003558A507